jgi:hypothetical protein
MLRFKKMSTPTGLREELGCGHLGLFIVILAPVRKARA